MAKKVPLRLRYLRVKDTSAPATRSGKACAEQMDALLACWRRTTVDNESCAPQVAALVQCAAGAAANVKSRAPPRASVNFVLSRYFASR